MENSKTVTFSLGGMIFEYDEKKNKINIEKHGISFKSAARVFFDYDRIEYYDEENSNVEDRYDIIGDLSAGTAQIERNTEIMIGNIKSDDVLFVVYTERIRKNENGAEIDVTRLISARYATNFERGLYYGKNEGNVYGTETGTCIYKRRTRRTGSGKENANLV